MLRVIAVAAGIAAALVLVLPAQADAPPVGPLPPGPVTSVQTRAGSLVAVALPHRAGGLVWRLARPVSTKVLVQVSEANVGRDVVVVYRTTGPGRATLAYGLTRGETRRAHESLSFAIQVRSRR